MTDKKQSFMKNVSIILIAQLLVKVFGLMYRMVITNVRGFGDAGNGFYTAGFQVYTLLLAISSVGVPNAIAKMVAERTAVNDHKGAFRVFRTAFALFAGIGFVCSCALFFGADFVAYNIVKMSGVEHTMRALAPSIFFVCVSSVIRGYFVGLQNMGATSTSQVLEQIFKTVLTIVFVLLAVGQEPQFMAAWANFATSLATVLSFGYLLLFYKKHKKGIDEKLKETDLSVFRKITPGQMIKSILMISVPISLGSVITAINRVIDTATITRGIEIAFAGGIPAFGNTPAVMFPTAEQLNSEAVRLAGVLGKSDTLINMPLALNIAFATVLVPSISSALAVGDKKEAASKINYSFLISILLILPCAFGYIALAQPIYKLIYPNAQLGYDLLQISSIALIFTALNQTMSGSLQGMGKVYTPATGLLLGCAVKIILNIILIRIPEINIYGAAISSVACQIVSFSVCFGVLARNIPLKMNIVKYVIKPLIAGGVMAAVAYFGYMAISAVVKANLVSLPATIAVAAVVYFILVFKLRILSEEEIKMLPSGVRLYGLLIKLKLI
ncbi:MAG: polysaccharide biosynthesis protein [Clostridia bacterium]|nr:polysaccharide biosynthesis protein [Clostridia bacterium]